jgi:hypothetical protein
MTVDNRVSLSTEREYRLNSDTLFEVVTNLPAHIQEQLAALPPLVAPRRRGRQVQWSAYSQSGALNTSTNMSTRAMIALLWSLAHVKMKSSFT